MGISLCDEHKFTFHIQMKSFYYDKRMSELIDQGYLRSHPPGFTYIISLENGNLKIGTSRRLDQRFLELSRDFGSIKVLCVLDGGETREAFLHYKFRHHRIENLRLEQFKPHPEILAYASKHGINRQGLKALKYLPKDEIKHREFSNLPSLQRPFVPPKPKPEVDPAIFAEAQRLIRERG